MEAPDEVPVGQSFSVLVSLTLDEITPDVVAKPGKGATKTADGALALKLPDGDAWEIDVILSGPGFKLEGGGNRQKITLPRGDDSAPALFNLIASPLNTASKQRKLYATLWHRGSYLAKVYKPITVTESAIAENSPAPVTRGSPGAPQQKAQSPDATPNVRARPVTPRPRQSEPAAIQANNEPPQLTVYLLHDPDGEGGRRGQIIVNSPYLQPTVADYSPPADMRDWLASHYDRVLDELGTTSSIPLPDRTIPQLRGFGQSVYKYFAPRSFKKAFWKLHERLGANFTSIQIYTNDPVLPWELMRPQSDDGTQQRDFIGLEFRIARWHISNDSAQLDKPPQRLELKELVAIAPQYQGGDYLPNQAQEMAVLRKLPGYRPLSGTYSSVRSLLQTMPAGIIHFSGHGVVGDAKHPTYAIHLEDRELDVLTWRGMTRPTRQQHPFVFLNACDIGVAQKVANFVDGWAPAVLETGAGGYVGGLWPLTDKAAAGFSETFYTRLYGGLRKGAVKAAEILRLARRDFLKTGDPTYLAYAYYGDVNLSFVQN